METIASTASVIKTRIKPGSTGTARFSTPRIVILR